MLHTLFRSVFFFFFYSSHALLITRPPADFTLPQRLYCYSADVYMELASEDDAQYRGWLFVIELNSICERNKSDNDSNWFIDQRENRTNLVFLGKIEEIHLTLGRKYQIFFTRRRSWNKRVLPLRKERKHNDCARIENEGRNTCYVKKYQTLQWLMQIKLRKWRGKRKKTRAATRVGKERTRNELPLIWQTGLASISFFLSSSHTLGAPHSWNSLVGYATRFLRYLFHLANCSPNARSFTSDNWKLFK